MGVEPTLRQEKLRRNVTSPPPSPRLSRPCLNNYLETWVYDALVAGFYGPARTVSIILPTSLYTNCV